MYLWIHEHNPSYRVECTNDPFICIPCKHRLMAEAFRKALSEDVRILSVLLDVLCFSVIWY